MLTIRKAHGLQPVGFSARQTPKFLCHSVTIVDAGPQRERPGPAGRFQFSLATALIVVTGVSVALSLVVWHWTFGLMAAIVLVGGGWSAAARRAGYRKLAYLLAASALGVIAHVVLGVLFRLTADPDDLFGETWFHPCPLVWMSISTTLAAMALRGLRRMPVLLGIAGVYLTALTFPVIWGISTLLSWTIPLVGDRLPPPETGFTIAGAGFVAGAALATVTLPVTWPTGILFAMILRWVDPPTPASPDRGQQVISEHKAAPAHVEPSGRSP